MDDAPGSEMHAASQLPLGEPIDVEQLASYLEGSPLMWSS